MKFMVAVTTENGNTVLEGLTQKQVNQLVTAFTAVLDLNGVVNGVFIAVSEMMDDGTQNPERGVAPEFAEPV